MLIKLSSSSCRKIPKTLNCKSHNNVLLLIFGSLAAASAVLFISSCFRINFFAASIANHQPNSTLDAACSGKYIFIHDLPSKFNYDLLQECEKLLPMRNMCIYVQNDGFGPPIFGGATTTVLVEEEGFDPETWFDTNQFMLELIFHKRMKQYQCLTNNSSLADAIFVPFYAGLEAGRTLWAQTETNHVPGNTRQRRKRNELGGIASNVQKGLVADAFACHPAFENVSPWHDDEDRLREVGLFRSRPPLIRRPYFSFNQIF